jgi:hypothetical protein
VLATAMPGVNANASAINITGTDRGRRSMRIKPPERIHNLWIILSRALRRYKETRH